MDHVVVVRNLRVFRVSDLLTHSVIFLSQVVASEDLASLVCNLIGFSLPTIVIIDKSGTWTGFDTVAHVGSFLAVQKMDFF